MDKEILDMLKEFKQEFKTINVKLDGLENKFSGMESKQDEIFQVVKGLVLFCKIFQLQSCIIK